jgi:cysteine desulfurase/selenocysteine lyase
MSFPVEKIRRDFPILHKKINNKPIIYFDNSCVSLKPKQVVEAMNAYYYEFTACHGRSLHKFSNQTTREFNEKSRETVRKFLNARKRTEIVWTRNTTEGINLVANGLNLQKDDIVLTTDIEHNSNLLPWQFLSKRKGIVHKWCEVNSDGTFNMQNFEDSISNKVKLVSLVHTSNVFGTTIPTREVIKIAHDHGALVLLDSAQFAPHHPIDVQKFDVDFLAFSSHKALGPSGMGVLYGKQHLLEKLDMLLVGGETVKYSTYTDCEPEDVPQKFEAGLQNYAGAIGAARACKYLMDVGLEKIEKHEKELARKLIPGLLEIDGIQLISPHDPEKGSALASIIVPGIEPAEIAIALDEWANIMVRSGMHCVHSWFKAHNISGSLRPSLYLYNTKEEIEIFLENFKTLLSTLL